MLASLALVALYCTDSTMPELAPASWIGARRRFGTCEHAFATWRAVRAAVLGLNWTTIHCCPRAASILAQPARLTASAAAIPIAASLCCGARSPRGSGNCGESSKDRPGVGRARLRGDPQAKFTGSGTRLA